MGWRASPTATPAKRLPAWGSARRNSDVSDARVAMYGLSVVLLFLAAAAQVALVYIDRARLRHMLEEGTPRASALLRLLDEPSSSLSTILFVHTLALCAGAAAAFWFDLDIWTRTTLPWLAI